MEGVAAGRGGVGWVPVQQGGTEGEGDAARERRSMVRGRGLVGRHVGGEPGKRVRGGGVHLGAAMSGEGHRSRQVHLVWQLSAARVCRPKRLPNQKVRPRGPRWVAAIGAFWGGCETVFVRSQPGRPPARRSQKKRACTAASIAGCRDENGWSRSSVHACLSCKTALVGECTTLALPQPLAYSTFRDASFKIKLWRGLALTHSP